MLDPQAIAAWRRRRDASDALTVFAAELPELVATAIHQAFVLTEGLSVPRRVLQRMRSDRKGNRLLAFFGPGAGRGAAYVLAQMVLFALAWATLEPPALEWRRMLAICGYVCFFTGVPVFVFRSFWPARATTARLRVAILCAVLLVIASWFQKRYVLTGWVPGGKPASVATTASKQEAQSAA